MLEHAPGLPQFPRPPEVIEDFCRRWKIVELAVGTARTLYAA
jgi:hypothetical protein